MKFSEYLKEEFGINNKDLLIKNAKKILHLSHDDLDGYGSLIVGNYFFKGKDITLKPMNYGNIYDFIKQYKHDFNTVDIVVITDLNIDPKTLTKLFEEHSNIVYLDHHPSPISSNIEKWLIKDDSRCGTKLIYDYFSKLFNHENKKLADFVDCVDVGDRFIKNSPKWEASQVISCLLAQKIFNLDNMIPRFSFFGDSQYDSYEPTSVEMGYYRKIRSEQMAVIKGLEYHTEKEGNTTFVWAILPDDNLPLTEIMPWIIKNEPSTDFVILLKEDSFSMRGTDKFSLDAGKFLQKICPKWNGHPKAAGGVYKENPETQNNKLAVIYLIKQELAK